MGAGRNDLSILLSSYSVNFPLLYLFFFLRTLQAYMYLCLCGIGNRFIVSVVFYLYMYERMRIVIEWAVAGGKFLRTMSGV